MFPPTSSSSAGSQSSDLQSVDSVPLVSTTSDSPRGAENSGEFELLPLPAFRATASWRLVAVNRAWEVLTETSRSQAVGSSLFEWVQPVDIVRLQRLGEKPGLVESKSAPRWDMALKRGAGWVWVDLAAVWRPGDDGQESHFFCVLTDVTARRRQEEQVRSAFERERRLHQNMSAFVAMVSHELRLPLANIGYATELLQTTAENLSPERRLRYQRVIADNAARMARLADQLILSGQVESGSWQCSPESTDLRELCEAVIREFERDDSAKTRLRLIASPGDWLASVDPLLLRVSIGNLISNALKYSGIDSPVEIELTRGESGFALSVRDTGIGIPSVDHGRLLRPFQRGSNVGSIKGNGMGLAISRTCIELQGGRLQWNSSEGDGSTFTLRVPLRCPIASELEIDNPPGSPL